MDIESVYFNAEAERCTLGLAIMQPECVKAVTELKTEVFYYENHQEIHKALKALADDGKEIDIVTFHHWIVTNGKEEAVGGIPYVMSCTRDAFLPSMLKRYIEILHECYSRRRQRATAKTYAEKLDSGEDPETCWEWMLRTLTEIKQERDNGLISAMEAAMRTFDKLNDDAKDENEGKTRILSGISTLDNKLGGLSGSKYVAIGARPSVGKSIFALTYCVNAAKQGKRVLLVSLEMDEIDITERLLANLGNVPLHKMTSAQMDEKDWEGLAHALPQASGMSLWYSLEADTVEKVRRCAYEVYEGGGLDLIAIDYLQLMSTEKENSRMSRQEEVARISKGLRKLSQELKIPILVLTQLNRQSVSNSFGKKKAVKREPTMSEARESGAIEQDANIFMLLHNPERDEMKDDEQKEMWDTLSAKKLKLMKVIIEKNRMGTGGNVTIAFDGDHMRYLPIVRNQDAPY